MLGSRAEGIEPWLGGNVPPQNRAAVQVRVSLSKVGRDIRTLMGSMRRSRKLPGRDPIQFVLETSLAPRQAVGLGCLAPAASLAVGLLPSDLAGLAKSNGVGLEKERVEADQRFTARVNGLSLQLRGTRLVLFALWQHS